MGPQWESLCCASGDANACFLQLLDVYVTFTSDTGKYLCEPLEQATRTALLVSFLRPEEFKAIARRYIIEGTKQVCRPALSV